MSQQIRNSRRLRSRRGQTIVETALVLTGILLPLTLGLLQFGIIYNSTNTLQHLGREAGRFAAVHGTETTFDSADTQTSPASLKYYIKTLCASSGSIKYSDLTISTSPSALSSRSPGQPISVTLTYPMSKKIFIGKALPGLSALANNYTVTSTFLLE
jgi:Flp pilus assembly protein TadG